MLMTADSVLSVAEDEEMVEGGEGLERGEDSLESRLVTSSGGGCG